MEWPTKPGFLLHALAVAVLFAPAIPARAQLKGPVLPLPTTLVLEKPAPERGFGNRQVISVGVKDQTYRFVLRDAYVDDPAGKWFWNDIWRSVEQYQPNFQAQGTDSDAFAKIKPGDVVTVTGMYSATTRTFEVTNVSPGEGNFAPKKAY
jgi:hypothetical protein